MQVIDRWLKASSGTHYNYKVNSQNLPDSLIRTTTLLSTMSGLLSNGERALLWSF